MKGFATFVFVLCCLAICSDADAGWVFGRRAVCANGTCSTQPAKSITVQRTVTRTTTVGETATAQGVANIMARLGRIGHFGGHRWYEGVGCASTAQGAYGICCYANSGLTTYDYGIARGANGMYYACRRYRP